MTPHPKITATYRFTRDGTSPAGFASRNRPSTDALSVVATWALGGAGRSYSVLEDSDEALLVKLTLREDDIDQARNDMEVLCSKHGVTREVV
jgi:hypothetical protein